MNQLWAQVHRVFQTQGDVLELEAISDDGHIHRALLYPALTPPAEVGDCVLLNTTAQDLYLGTGGYDFVMAVQSKARKSEEAPGHIMKLRYTPCQHQVLSVEEPDSPYAGIFRDVHKGRLDGMPVVCASLHSQIAPLAAAIKAVDSNARIVYIMTDQAALSLSLSRVVAQLKDAGLIDTTITCGQAFGGDFEAVTLYSALLAARFVAQADCVLVSIGPGTVGTSTLWGTTGVAQGEAINAVQVLQGDALVCVRMSAADKRPRHYGISAHTTLSLTRIAQHTPAAVVLPGLERLSDEMRSEVELTLGAFDYFDPHHLEYIDLPKHVVSQIFAQLHHAGVDLRSMGRGYTDDPLFFDAAFCAGYAAALRLASCGQ